MDLITGNINHFDCYLKFKSKYVRIYYFLNEGEYKKLKKEINQNNRYVICNQFSRLPDQVFLFQEIHRCNCCFSQ